MQRPRTPQLSAGVRVRGKGEAKARRRAPAAREEHGAPRKARPAAMAVETGGGDERGFGVVVVEDVKCAGLDRWISFGLDR